jgi:two-component system nitrate/nitrite response regulator NarL
MEGVRRGQSNKQIARELDLREPTVKVHIRHIMRKLGARNRTQIALIAERLRLTDS